MDGHDSPQIGNNDIDYKPTKLLSAFLVIVLARMKGE